MSTHKPNDPNQPGGPDPEAVRGTPSDDRMSIHQASDPESLKAGYELTDANVTGVVTFLVVLAASVAVVFVLAFGMGKLIYMGLNKTDGPANKWRQMAGVKSGNMESNPQIEQQQLQSLVKRFPAPRLEADDGNMDVAEMHAREDMLLNYYTWANESKQTVRIPIARAMQLIAQRGLPVVQDSAPQEQAMFGDTLQNVTAPLTDGFARTGPELEMIQAREQRLEMQPGTNTRAELNSGK